MIGVTARLIGPDPHGPGARRRPMWGLDRALSAALQAEGLLVALLPVPAPAQAEAEAAAWLPRLDGLVLQGGTDIEPWHWGETPLGPHCAGDPWRDAFEFALCRGADRRGLPTLGICRGIQVMNVARGGDLYQDLPTQRPDATAHDGAEAASHRHPVELVPDGALARCYGRHRGTVSSTHHQALRRLGRGLVVEARHPEDGIIEAIRDPQHPYFLGVQWHPELHPEPADADLAGAVLFADFARAVHTARR